MALLDTYYGWLYELTTIAMNAHSVLGRAKLHFLWLEYTYYGSTRAHPAPMLTSFLPYVLAHAPAD